MSKSSSKLASSRSSRALGATQPSTAQPRWVGLVGRVKAPLLLLHTVRRPPPRFAQRHRRPTPRHRPTRTRLLSRCLLRRLRRRPTRSTRRTHPLPRFRGLPHPRWVLPRPTLPPSIPHNTFQRHRALLLRSPIRPRSTPPSFRRARPVGGRTALPGWFGPRPSS